MLITFYLQEATLEQMVVGIAVSEPSVSTRRIAARLNTSQSTVWRILRRNMLHPYHMTPVQDLLPTDSHRRAEFCRYILEQHELDANYLNRILWTDEAKFTRDGVFNYHNEHFWSPSNPHMTRTRSFQHRFSFNVWAGVIGNTLLGPIFLPDIINSENYLSFLHDTYQIILDEVPLSVREHIIFQHDGAPPHCGSQVRQWLNRTFNNWIGRGGTIEWPPRSPDLTPLDFYVWGCMKNFVYARRINNEEQLRDLILEAGQKLKDNIRQIDIVSTIRRRLHLCLIKNGEHFEQLL